MTKKCTFTLTLFTLTDFDINVVRVRNNTVQENRISAGGNTDYGNDEFESRRIVITSLEKYEKYCAKVRGGTIVDVGPYSDEVCVYTDQDGMFLLLHQFFFAF